MGESLLIPIHGIYRETVFKPRILRLDFRTDDYIAALIGGPAEVISRSNLVLSYLVQNSEVTPRPEGLLGLLP